MIRESVTEQEVLRTIMYYLKNTDRKESVDAIFNIVERLDEVMYNNLKDAVIQVLFNLNSSLQNNQKKRIHKRIDDLLRSTNSKIKERGIELSSRSR